MSKLYLILIGALFCASTLQAQTTTVADSLELDEVVVTASKIPTTQRETTKPVIIIDRAEIDRNSGRTLSQLLNQQSGIRVNDSYGAPSNNRSLFMQGASNQYTLILVDGLAITDPSEIGGTLDLRLLPMNNIERIEIIKGSQSTLYGTNAIAGVINIITKEGEGRIAETNGQLSYGSYNSFQGSVGVNGAFENDGQSLRYTLNYNREISDGISAAKSPGDGASFENDGYSMNSFYGRVDFSPVENLTFSPFINYSDYTGDYDADAFQDADNVFNLNLFNPGLLVDYSGDRFRLNGGYNITKTERAFRSQFGFSEFEGRMENVDLYGSYLITDNFQVLTGLNYQDFRIPVELEDGDDLSSQITSPYATLLVKNLYGFNAELGYRLNSHSEYDNNSTVSFSPSYNITENLKLFASASTGFKAPTLTELFGQFGANPDLEPQRSRYYSGGLESYLFDKSLKLSAQYFQREVRDLIIFAGGGYINQDRQEDRGVEFTANWLVNSRMTIGGHYNFITGERTEEDVDGNETSSENLIRQPTHSFGGRIGVDVTDRVRVNIDGEFNSERTDLFFNPDTFVSEEVTLSSYTLINFHAAYRFPNNQITLFGDVRNLLDQNFTEVYGYNTMGLNVKAGLRFTF